MSVDFKSKVIVARLAKEERSIQEELRKFGHLEPGSEEFKRRFKKEMDTRRGIPEFVSRTVELRKREDLERLYELMENNTANRMTAFAFSHFTGVPAGTTNKQGKQAFIDVFGSAIPDVYREKEEAAARAEAQRVQEEKDAKRQAMLDYFDHPLWDRAAVEKLTPIQFARAKKSLDTLHSYDGVVMTDKRAYEGLDVLSKSRANKCSKFSERTYNNFISSGERSDYRAKLLKGRLYFLDWNDNGREAAYGISKTVFELLALKDVTNEESLSESLC